MASFNEDLDDFAFLGNSFTEMLKMTIDKKLEFSEVQNTDSNIMVNGFLSNIKSEVDNLMEDFNLMGINNGEYKNFIENVYYNIVSCLPDFEELLEQYDVSMISSFISRKVKQDINFTGANAGLLKALVGRVNEILVPHYLSTYNEISKLTSPLDDVWGKFVIEKYYNDTKDDASCPGLNQKITKLSSTEEGNWKNNFLAQLGMREEDNIVFNNFSEWLSKNYSRLVSNFYKWKENRPMPYEGVSVSEGNLLLAFTEVAIMELLSDQSDHSTLISLEEFSKLSNDLTQLLTNNELKSLFLRMNGGSYNRYLMMIINERDYYVRYSSSRDLTNDVIDSFSKGVSRLFVNQCESYLAFKLKRFEEINPELNDYKISYARWIENVSNNILSKMVNYPGGGNAFFKDATESVIEELFDVDYKKMPAFKSLYVTRGAYGSLLNSLDKLMTLSGLNKKEIHEAGSLDLTSKKVKKYEGVSAEDLIAKKWNEFVPGDAK